MKPQTRRRKKQQDTLVLQLLVIVALVLVIFEGRLIVTMVQYRSVTNTANSGNIIVSSESEDTAAVSKNPDTVSGSTSNSGALDITLAGLPEGTGLLSTQAAAKAEKIPTVSNPDSPAIVKKNDTPVDDSYFSDAVFIGDSRMEGFRNASGITQGRFFTSVGMSVSKMAQDPIISTAEGTITVAAALSGGSYNKVYIMLGANDLGEYDWDSFHDRFVSAVERFQEIQPNALFYICSCIYVEESKVTTGDYVNNTNVDKINSILLQICEEEGYYYLDLNEILSNGYGALIQDASSDGVHIYEKYCKQMLDYLKNHYIEADAADTNPSGQESSEKETNETEQN